MGPEMFRLTECPYESKRDVDAFTQRRFQGFGALFSFSLFQSARAAETRDAASRDLRAYRVNNSRGATSSRLGTSGRLSPRRPARF